MVARFGGAVCQTTSGNKLKEYKKHLITSNLKVKSTVPYEILLAETGMFLMEASAVIQLLSYLKKVEKMDKHHWPKLVVEERLVRRKKTWMNQNKEWVSKWDIDLHTCPNTKEEIKRLVLEKFRAVMWTKQMGRKKAHYVKEFNPTWEHDEKDYL